MSKIDINAKNNISKEIIILGILVVLYSFQGIPTFDFESYAVKFRPLAEEIILARYVFSIIFRVAIFVIGIGILFRKEIFRKSIIGFSLFTIATVYWKHPVSVFKRVLMWNIQQGAVSADMLPRIDILAWESAVFCYTVDIVIASVLIYLFTRPHISEQFK